MNKIKEARYHLSVTQAEMAEKIGISRQSLNAVEHGKGSYASTLKACQYLGVNVFSEIDVGKLLKVAPKNEEEARMLIRAIEERYL